MISSRVLNKLPRCLDIQRKCVQYAARVSAPLLQSQIRECNSEAIPIPTPAGEEKQYAPKIKQIVDEISKLTLIEVADLNSCLKKTLNIQDSPMMAMGAMPMSAAAPAEEEEEEAPKAEKTSFNVKLMKFESTKKIQIIKEIKSLIPGTNLVQAKKFVESCPQVVRGDVAKDEAEKLKTALEAVGGVVEIE